MDSTDPRYFQNVQEHLDNVTELAAACAEQRNREWLLGTYLPRLYEEIRSLYSFIEDSAKVDTATNHSN